MAQLDAEKLAKMIAGLIDGERADDGMASIKRSLDAINERLERLEAAHTPATAPAVSIHPSQDRFAIAEAIADQIFAAADKEKACTFEPNGKPCDHCSMCSSRGF
jgi:hypothetical protein